jgi:DNA-binding NtrC family response regulator
MASVCYLLSDDEASVLAVTAKVLSRLGYEPVSFSDIQSALAAFEAAPERFDVVVTDQVMPGLTGTGLASGYCGPAAVSRLPIPVTDP